MITPNIHCFFHHRGHLSDVIIIDVLYSLDVDGVPPPAPVANMAELNHENEVDQDVPPLLEVILEELNDIEDKWREVGEVLKVSKTKLDDIQERGVNDKDNFKIVLKEWMDKNMSTYMWSSLLQALNNSTINMHPSRIEQLRETYCNRAEGE